MNDLHIAQEEPTPKTSVWFYIKLIILVVIVTVIFVATFFFINFKEDVPNLISDLKQESVATEIQNTINNGDFDGAIEMTQTLNNERGGEDIEALIGLGFAYLHKGTVMFEEEENSKKALEVADAIITQEPENPIGHHLKGYAYEIVEDYDKAIASYQKSIEVDPEYLPSYGQLGHAYDLLGDKEQARDYYERALSMKTTFDFALMNLGRLEYRDGNIDSAKEYFERALEHSYDIGMRSQILHMLGVIERDNGNLVEAENLLKEALKVNPNLSTTWVILAELYVSRADAEGLKIHLENAKEAAQNALAIHKHDAYAYMVLGDIAQRHENNVKKAEAYYTQALQAIDLDITLGAQEKINAHTEVQGMITSLSISQ